MQNPTVVDAKLAKELELQRLAGPFESPPLSPLRVSPLRVVPKKTPVEYRLIHHLSPPKVSSANDVISSEHTSVKYATTDGAIQLIKKAGHSCFMAKTDIKNPFRIISIRPEDYGLLGCNGGIFIILIDASPWAAHFHVQPLKLPVPQLNGLPIVK